MGSLKDVLFKQSSEERLALLLLVAQPLVFFRTVLIGRTRHIPFDILEWHLPIASFIARCLRDHVWPFWNPYVGCGAPGFADIQAQMFYPPTALAILISNLQGGKNLYYLLQALEPVHMCLAGIFLYLVMRKLGCTISAAAFAGVTFEGSAFFASQA